MYDPGSNTLLNKIIDDLKVDLSVPENKLFFSRLSANFYELQARYARIYSNQKAWERHFITLIKDLFVFHNDRSPQLKKSDLQREKEPGWLISEHWAGAMLYVDRFGRNLMGVKRKLDYLTELGVNLVHLIGIWQSPLTNNDGGYAVNDYTQIDSRYGSSEDLNVVIAELKKRRMLLALDLVINHTSDQHQWAKKAKNGVRKYQKYFYMFEDRTVPDLFERTLPEVFPVSDPGNFTFDEKSQKWVMTVFHRYQWDLNYYNPEVFREILKVLFFQANLGIDLIRIDAPGFIWKKMGSPSQNETETHIILQMFKACLQIVAPGAGLIAQAMVSSPEIIKYFGRSSSVSNECDIAHNTTLMTSLWDAVATQNSNLSRAVLEKQPQKPAGTTWLNYVRCQDDIGLNFVDKHIKNAGYNVDLHRKFLVEFLTGDFKGSFAKGLPFMPNAKTGDTRISGSLASLAGLEDGQEKKKKKLINTSIKRINLLHSIIVSFGGIPLIYYGDEIATLNDYSYQEDPDKRDDNRWVHRSQMNWDLAELRKKRGSLQHITYTTLQRFIKIRKASPEFADLNNCQIIDTGNHFLLAYLRYKGQLRTLIVCNLNGTTQRLKASILSGLLFDVNQKLVDKLTGTEIILVDQQVSLDPYQSLWISKHE